MKAISPAYLASLIVSDNDCSMRDAAQAVNAFMTQLRESAQPPVGLRDEFAMRTVATLYTAACVAARDRQIVGQVNVYEIAAVGAYEQADAMLEARKPKPAPEADYALAVRAGYRTFERQTHVGTAWDITWPGKTAMHNFMYKTEQAARDAAVERFTSELERSRQLLALVG